MVKDVIIRKTPIENDDLDFGFDESDMMLFTMIIVMVALTQSLGIGLHV